MIHINNADLVVGDGNRNASARRADVGSSTFNIILCRVRCSLALLAVCVPLQLYADAPPNAPSGLTASVVSPYQVHLTWSDNSNDEDGFKIERFTSRSDLTLVAQVPANTTNYLDTVPVPGLTYYYRVRAYNSGGDSAYSGLAIAATPIPPPCLLSVVGWGNNGDGETDVPTNLTQVAAIAAGTYHSLALKSDGKVVGWGADWDGQATPPTNLNGVVAISGGGYHSLALKGDGTVVGWGADWSGQASPPPDLTNTVAIAAGQDHSLALKSDGTVVGWGYYDYATPPADLSNVVAIAAGREHHSLALKGDGTVVGWGYNYYGETTPPADLSNVVAIAAGGYHSLALKGDGTVVGWGADWDGQATPPEGLSNVVAIAAGWYHSLALKSDGTVVGWGYDYDGEASGAEGLTGASAIAAGGYHSLALTTAPPTPSDLLATIVDTNQVSGVTNLVWSDEFDGIGSGVDATKWKFDFGNSSTIAGAGWGNGEREIYTARTNNAYVANGLLHIVAQKENLAGQPYTSARLTSEGRFAPQYGRFEFRAKLPAGLGFWPALWLLATNYPSLPAHWPACGEIDVMENNGSLPNQVFGTLHYDSSGNPNVDVADGGAFTFPAGDGVTNFHTYVLRWTPNLISFSVDDQPAYKTITSWTSSTDPYPAPFDKPFYIILNLAVGGSFLGYPSDSMIDANTTFPGEMQVDYVRIYEDAPLLATVQLSWADNSANEDGFEIERAQDNGGSPGMWEQIATVGANVTSYYDTDAVVNATYWYRVRASSTVCGDSASTRTVVSLTPPAAPYSLSAYGVATNQVEVDLYWNPGSGNEAGYKIERAPDDNGNHGAWTEIATVVGGTNTFYSDTTVAANTLDWYRIRAYNLLGDSDYSYPASVSVTPPYAPYVYSATLVATNQIEVQVQWSASGTELGYKLERAPDVSGSPGAWAEIANISGAFNNSYTDTGVLPNATYWYRVRAYNLIGDSDYSNQASISLVAPPNSVYPYAYPASANQPQVDLYWYDYYNYSAGVAGYKIERAADAGGNPGTWSEIASVTNGYSYYNFYSDTGVIPNATYWYRVRAFNAVGNAPYSYQTSVSVEPPNPPSYLYASLVATNQAEVDMSWYDYNYSGNVAGYQIERAPDASGNPGAWVQIAVTTNGYSNYSMYIDVVPPMNATYWYRVRAYNAVGGSDAYPVSVSVAPPGAPYVYGYPASANGPGIDVYWYASYGVPSGYKLERAPDVSGSPGTWAVITDTADDFYHDANVLPNTTYWYRVLAYNLIGHSEYSSPISLSALPPSYAPYYLYAYLVATNQPEVHLYWYDYSNSSSDVTGYKLERAPDVSGSPGTWTEIATLDGYSYYSQYIDTGVPPNAATYWYRVRAFNAVGDSPTSYEISVAVVPPSAPCCAYAYLNAFDHVEVDLYWSYTSGIEAGYKIERAPDVGGTPGTWAEIATTVGPYSTSYADTAMTPDATYWYRVRAYNAIGDSDYSIPVSVDVVPPGTPSSLTALVGGTNQVDLSWFGSSGNVTGYKIERAPDAGGNPGAWTEIANTQYSTSYSDMTVETNQTYWYRVRAYNAVGDSPYAGPVSVTISPPTAPPSSLTATPVSASRIDLSWTDNSDNETSFKIERSADGTNFTQIAQVLANTTSYRNTGLFADRTYYYRVRASNPVGDSAFSNIANANTPAQCSASVVGWGSNYYGEITPPTNLADVVAIAGGAYHSLALKRDGTVVGWGDNYDGQATPPTNLTGVVAIAAGTYHSLALKSDGTVVGWGYNGYGQATPPVGLSNVVAIAAGYYHSLALESDGTVIGWGYYYYATPPAGLVGVVAIAAGSEHSLAVKSDGTVVGWGYDGYGQATPPPGLSNVLAVAGGDISSLALKSDGTVTNWGYSYYGDPPSGLTGAVAIAAGYYHVLALKSDGTVVGWGYNYDGQATPPAGLTAVAIAAGGYHSLALSTTPSAPTAVAASVLAADEVRLSWTDTDGHVDGFNVERALDNGGSPGSWAPLATVASTTYTDSGLMTKTTYWYRVQAFNACTNSAYSVALRVLASQGQVVRVMQWNIEGHLGNIVGNNSSAARAIARIINYNQPDILLINEINTQGLTPSDNRAALVDWVTNNITYLGAQPGVTFYVAVSSQSDGFLRNGAISRYPILTAGTYDDGLRGLHSFRVQLNGANALQVFHAHLKCCSDDCPRKHYEAQFDADTISAWAATNTIPYIFAGDWNDDEQSPLCASPNTIRTIREDGGLVEFRPTTLDGEYRTWSTSSASIRFDYILAATNRLAPLSGYVFSSTVWANHGLYNGNSSDSFVASDHYCIFADYFLPSPDFTVAPVSTFASTGYLGGPFSPTNMVYTLTNTNSIPLYWGVTTSANWLTISATNGVLGAGASTNITASINGTASSLSVSNYTATVVFQNTVTESPVSRSASLTVLWPPPVASFTGSPTNGVDSLIVTFTDTTTGNVTGRFWNFGDGSTANVSTTSVVHTYTAGSFSVTLVATGPGGVSTNSRPNYINVLTGFQNWQIRWFGSTTNPAAAAGADPDGDGQNNMAESLAGTNPTNSASVFGIVSIMPEGGNVRITWKAVGGKTNIVQGGAGDFDNDNPAYSNLFFDMSDPIIIQGGGDTVTNFIDDSSWWGDFSNWPVHYYRVRLVP